MTGIKLKSTKIIVLSAAAILLSIVVLVVSNFYFLKSTNYNLTEVDNLHNKKLDIILRMTHIVRERSILMLTMYLDDDVWKVDEQYMKYNKLARDFILLREQIQTLVLTNVEQQQLDTAFTYIRMTEPLQNEIVERIRAGGDTQLRSDISLKDLPLEYKLLDIFNLLSNNIRENAHAARQHSRQLYTRSVLSVGMVSLLITISIVILMYRSLRKIQTLELGLIKETTSLSWDATHDPLTNIFNRRWLSYKIEQFQRNEADKQDVHSIVYIDLDNFKPINDRFGHATGDRYLMGFCREVEHHIRHNDIFARIGGDEFVILLDNCDLDKARDIADNLLKKISTFSIDVEGNKIATNCSIGLLSFNHDATDFDELLHQADALCYEAKRLGKNNVYCELTKN